MTLIKSPGLIGDISGKIMKLKVRYLSFSTVEIERSSQKACYSGDT